VIPRERVFQGFVEWYPETLLDLRRWQESSWLQAPRESARLGDAPSLRDLLVDIARGEKNAMGLYFLLGDLCTDSQLKALWSRFAREDGSHFFKAGVGLLRLGTDTNLSFPRVHYPGCHCRSLEGLVFTLNQAIRCKLGLVQSYERFLAAGAGGEFAAVLRRECLHLQILAESFLPPRLQDFPAPRREKLCGPDPDSVGV